MKTKMVRFTAKIICCFMVLSAVLGVIPVSAKSNPVVVSVINSSGEQGSEVAVGIKLSNVPKNGVMAANFQVEFDKSKLTMDKVKGGEIVHNPTFDINYNANASKGAVILYSDYDQKDSYIKSSGGLCYLIFKVKPNCPPGDYNIKLSPFQKVGKNKNYSGADPFYTSGGGEVKAIFNGGKITVVSPAASGASTKVQLVIGIPYMTANGAQQEIDPGKFTSPVVMNNRTMLPIASIVKAFNGTVQWNGSEQKVTVQLQGKTIELWIGKSTAKVDGSDKTLDAAPQTKNGRTFLPVSFIAKNCGLDVNWNGKAQLVTISK